MVIESKIVFNNLAIVISAICGYYIYLSIAAYHLTKELSGNAD